MNRITKINGMNYIARNNEAVLTDVQLESAYQQCFDKLGQLEDIEEEIGIDLITKDKVEKNRYVFVGYQNSIEINQVEIKKYGRLGIDIYDKNAVFKYNYLSYKDYGKTWALTREELENEN